MEMLSSASAAPSELMSVQSTWKWSSSSHYQLLGNTERVLLILQAPPGHICINNKPWGINEQTWWWKPGWQQVDVWKIHQERLDEWKAASHSQQRGRTGVEGIFRDGWMNNFIKMKRKKPTDGQKERLRWGEESDDEEWEDGGDGRCVRGNRWKEFSRGTMGWCEQEDKSRAGWKKSDATEMRSTFI